MRKTKNPSGFSLFHVTPLFVLLLMCMYISFAAPPPPAPRVSSLLRAMKQILHSPMFGERGKCGRDGSLNYLSYVID